MDEIYNQIIKMHGLTANRIIGKGGYGIVYSVKNEKTELAMKFIPLINNKNHPKFQKTIHSI